MKKFFYFILLISVSFSSIYSQVVIKNQSFDTDVPSTLGFTTTTGTFVAYSGNSGTGDRPATSPYYTDGDSAWGVTNTTVVTTYDNVLLSGYTNCYIKFRLQAMSIGSTSNGPDPADTVCIAVSTDNGSTWSNEITVKGPAANNAWWSYSGGLATAEATFDGDNSPVVFQPAGTGERTTDGYSTVKVNIPNSYTQVRFRIVMRNNSANERWVTDQIEVWGTSTGGTPVIGVSTPSMNLGIVLNNTNSEIHSYKVWGKDMTANVLISAPSYYQISRDSLTFKDTLWYALNGSNLDTSKVFVRFSPVPSGTFTGNISHSSTGASTVNVSVTGKSLANEPTSRSSHLSFPEVTDSTVKIKWDNGDGGYRIVLVKQAAVVDSVPTDGMSYTASTTFGSGSQIGTLNYVVHNGPSSGASDSVTVRGLSSTTTYYFAVFDYNGTGGGENYFVSAYGTGNVTTTGPALTELVVPKYFGSKSAAGSNNCRTPFAVCLQITGLSPSTTFDVQVGIGLTSDAPTSYGAGNIWNGTAFSNQRVNSAFTTDALGNSGAFWVYLQPTGNATRFDAGQIHNLRVGYVISGGTMPGNPNFVGGKTLTALDIPTSARTPSTNDDGAFIKGYAFTGSSGKYVLIYDNENGTGDPLFSNQIRTTVYTNTTQSELPTAINDVYLQSGTSSVGDFAAVVPTGANNPNGIRRIEVRNPDNTLFYAMTDANGNWNGVKTGSLSRRQVDSIEFSNYSLTLIQQGYFNTGTGVLNQSDTVTAFLANSLTPFAFVDTAKRVIDSVDYTAHFLFRNAANGTYYIVVRHRNSLETWSKSGGEAFNNNINQIFNFTTAKTQAYGDNLVLSGTKWCLFSGDMNQDGAVLTDDYDLWFNYFISGETGKGLLGDLNGDGSILTDDYDLWFNAFTIGAGKITPSLDLRRLNLILK